MDNIYKTILSKAFNILLALSFLFALGLLFPKFAYACPETNVVKVESVTGSSCVQSDFCGSVSNTCHKACGSAGSINPIYDRRLKFTYTDNTTCESTVIFKSETACNGRDLTQQAEPSCVNTCNPTLAGVREGITINNTGPCTGGSYCTGGLADHCPANATTTGPGSWCEAWTCNWGSNCGTPSWSCGPNPSGPYNTQDACNASCPSPPTVTLTVNNVFALTLNKGEGYVLAWNTTNSPTNCTATGSAGSWSWNLNSPPNNLSSGTTTDSKQDAGTYIYTLTCSNAGGSDTKSVSVTVKKTCPDYTTDGCSTCVSQDTCGWKGDNNTCQTGTSSCPANTSSWYWTDCLTNQCATPAPSPTATTTCTGSPTCSISASATSSTSGRATISKTGGCSTGYDRVEWFLGPSGGTLQSQGSNNGPSADFNNLTTNTTYNVSASWWSTDSTKPSVTCQPPASFSLTSIYPTPTSSTSTNIGFDCLYCSFSKSSGVWVNKGEQSCNSGWNALGGICKDSGYPWACDRPGETNNPQYTVIPDLAASTNPPARGTACKKQATSSSSSSSSPGSAGIYGAYLVRNGTSETLTLRDIYPIRWWVADFQLDIATINAGGHCILTAPGPICYQEDYSNQAAGLSYAGNGDAPMGEVGANANATLFRDHLQLTSWPDGYRPIGYYTYQDGIARTHTSYTCSRRVTKPECCGLSATVRDATPGCPYSPEDDPGCSDCGGTNCITGYCSSETVTDGYTCKLLSDAANPVQSKYSVKSGFQALGSLTKNTNNEITTYCAPNSLDNARVDLVFEKLPLFSGLVCQDNNGDGNCITGSGASRTCTISDGGTYTTGTVTAINTSTSQQTLRPVTPGGGYSMYLSSGSYNVNYTVPNVTVTSPTILPVSKSITSDTTQDFCVNPTSAWLKTTGGDVHSNTRINLPKGP